MNHLLGISAVIVCLTAMVMLGCANASGANVDDLYQARTIDRFIDAGYDHVILVQVGPNQDGFFDLFERELAPALRKRAAG